MSKEFLQNLKEGDIVVRALIGGGFTTESLIEIESVRDNGIFIEGCDGDYEADSVYRFSKTTGRSVNNYMAGFSSQIVRLATDEDKENLE